MAMMNERNNRSCHTEDARIRQSLKRHADLMAEFEQSGLSRDAASKKAFLQIRYPESWERMWNEYREQEMFAALRRIADAPSGLSSDWYESVARAALANVTAAA